MHIRNLDNTYTFCHSIKQTDIRIRIKYYNCIRVHWFTLKSWMRVLVMRV